MPVVDSLESLIGEVLTVHDPFFGPGGPLKWVSTYGDPEPLCRLIQKESSGNVVGLPSREDVWNARGFWAHLKITEHNSGILVGEVHAEFSRNEHTPVAYYNQPIIECRGLTSDDKTDYGPHSTLQGLSRGGVSFGVTSQALGLPGIYGTVTSGSKFVKVPEGQIELSYSVAKQVTSENGTELPPVFLGISASVSPVGKPQFNLSFRLAQMQPLSYSGELSHSNTSIIFGHDGKVTEVKSVDMERGVVLHPATRWGLIFAAVFSARSESVPNIDILSTMQKIIGVSTTQGSERISVESFLVYK